MIVLASSSPWRRALLDAAGVAYRSLPVDVDETSPPGLSPEAVAVALAERKARAAATRVVSGLVLGADTLVVLDGEILGKPASADHARELLGRLSGREHLVVTGVFVLDAATGRTGARAVTSRVRFRELSSAEIGAYVATGEPLDKAGGYGIQGGAGAFVAALDGPRDNVVGLPVAAVLELLREAAA